MSKTDKIFVTGGTGFLGSYLLRLLLKNGYQNIRALKRNTSDMAMVADIETQIEWVEGDVTDIFLLEQAMDDVSVIYHCAAIVSFDPKDFEYMMHINVTGTSNIVNVALDEGVEKLVHVSSIAALAKTKDTTVLNENTKWQRSGYNSDYGISKYLSEQEVWRGYAEGLNVAVVNPSVILGSGFWLKGTGHLFVKVLNGLPFYPLGTTGFVDVRDVARFMLELMESEISGQRFVLNSENLSYKIVFSEMAKSLHKKVPTMALNKLVTGAAWRAEWLRSKVTGNRPVITRQTMRQSAREYFYENEKSKSALDFNYIPIHQTIEETCEQLLQAAKENMKPMVLPFV